MYQAGEGSTLAYQIEGSTRLSEAKEAAAARGQVFALPCGQRQVKCGRCKQMRWLLKESAVQNCGGRGRGGGEEEGDGHRDRSAQSGRRRRDAILVSTCEVNITS